MSVAALGGCARGGGGPPTAPTPGDALAVTVDGGGYEGFAVALDCELADRDACAGVLDAVGASDPPDGCRPLPIDGARILVRGVIDGERVVAVLRRRTTCEAAAFDRALEALGL